LSKPRNKVYHTYMIKSVYKDLIIKKEKAGQDTSLLRSRLERIHGAKWIKILEESITGP